MRGRRRPAEALAAALAAVLLSPSPAPAQSAPRSEVELPLATYDRLRQEAKGPREAPRKPPSVGAVRLLRAGVTVDVGRRRASWEAEMLVAATGEAPPSVTLLAGAAPVARWSVSPEAARVVPGPSATRLTPDRAGTFRVTMGGELTGSGDDETAGVRFSLPPLGSVPAAFDVSVPKGYLVHAERARVATTTSRDGGVTARVTLAGEASPVLVVKRPSVPSTGPAVVDGDLHAVVRVAESSARTEVRLSLRVRKGLLEKRTLLFPGASLVSAAGPVLAEGPAADGAVSLRFEPPVPERGSVSVTLAFLAPRDGKDPSFVPALPGLVAGSEERVRRRLTVVSEGGLLMEAAGEEDWSPRTDLSDVATSGEEVALGWTAKVLSPRPPRLTLTRLKPLAVATALARARLVAFVGEGGEARTLLLCDVRTKGRPSLAFRVPADAVLLAARVDGVPAPASRPAPDRVEVPIAADSGRTRVDLLLGGRVAPPRPGESLRLEAPAPLEPVERTSWSLVLPPGLGVKEEGRNVPPLPDAEPPERRAPDPPEDGEALEKARELSRADAAASAEGTWWPRAALPAAPLTWATDLVEVTEGIAPLVVTVVERKEKEPWF
ncbi:MAG: hypothetical protein EDX89_10230 [Acidobacteria bacterium]|nr:MAG: hypothetical protein EDX89_10230 [Acidobacteriota bacterium]